MLEGNCSEYTIASTAAMEANATGNCYNLKLDQDLYSNVFKIDLTGVDSVLFFAEHVPTEFERSAHYFIDAKGVDIEPVAEVSPEPEKDKEYGAVIAACLVVNSCTLIGLLTLTPCVKKSMDNEATKAAWLSGSSAFAAGALLAAAGYLMVPEGALPSSSSPASSRPHCRRVSSCADDPIPSLLSLSLTSISSHRLQLCFWSLRTRNCPRARQQRSLGLLYSLALPSASLWTFVSPQ